MKKGLLLVGLTSVLGVAGLASCANDGPTNKTILNRDQSLSMQAATSLSMLNQHTSAKALRMAKKFEAKGSITEAEKEDIKKILPTLDLMLENSSSFDSTVNVGEYKIVVSDQTYTYNIEEKISFTGTDGEDLSYYLYYTDPSKATDPDAGTPDAGTPDSGTPDAGTPETGTDSTAPAAAKNYAADDDDDDDDDDDEEEAGKVEVEETIKGLATTDKATYYDFSSKVEKETSKDETEEERTFKIETGVNSYIQVKQEHEVEGNEIETEFKYKIVENGNVTLEYAIEIENEDNQLEIGYEIGEKEYELVKTVTGEGDAKEIIYNVEYENDSNDVEALIKFKKVTKETGEVEYEIIA